LLFVRGKKEICERRPGEYSKWAAAARRSKTVRPICEQFCDVIFQLPRGLRALKKNDRLTLQICERLSGYWACAETFCGCSFLLSHCQGTGTVTFCFTKFFIFFLLIFYLIRKHITVTVRTSELICVPINLLQGLFSFFNRLFFCQGLDGGSLQRRSAGRSFAAHTQRRHIFTTGG
jgi:hypothetical protein